MFHVIADDRFLRAFPSFKEADEWITGELRVAAKGDRRKIELRVVLPNGDPATLLGVNLNTGNLRLNVDSNYSEEVYAYTPQVEKLVSELAVARTRVNTIAEMLHGTRLTRYSHGRLESAGYNSYIASVVKQYEAALTHAKSLNKQERQGVPES